MAARDSGRTRGASSSSPAAASIVATEGEAPHLDGITARSARGGRGAEDRLVISRPAPSACSSPSCNAEVVAGWARQSASRKTRAPCTAPSLRRPMATCPSAYHRLLAAPSVGSAPSARGETLSDQFRFHPGCPEIARCDSPAGSLLPWDTRSRRRSSRARSTSCCTDPQGKRSTSGRFLADRRRAACAEVERRTVDLELTTEFLLIAATLVELKRVCCRARRRRDRRGAVGVSRARPPARAPARCRPSGCGADPARPDVRRESVALSSGPRSRSGRSRPTPGTGLARPALAARGAGLAPAKPSEEVDTEHLARPSRPACGRIETVLALARSRRGALPRTGVRCRELGDPVVLPPATSSCSSRAWSTSSRSRTSASSSCARCSGRAASLSTIVDRRASEAQVDTQSRLDADQVEETMAERVKPGGTRAMRHMALAATEPVHRPSPAQLLEAARRDDRRSLRRAAAECAEQELGFQLVRRRAATVYQTAPAAFASSGSCSKVRSPACRDRRSKRWRSSRTSSRSRARSCRRSAASTSMRR